MDIDSKFLESAIAKESSNLNYEAVQKICEQILNSGYPKKTKKKNVAEESHINLDPELLYKTLSFEYPQVG